MPSFTLLRPITGAYNMGTWADKDGCVGNRIIIVEVAICHWHQLVSKRPPCCPSCGRIDMVMLFLNSFLAFVNKGWGYFCPSVCDKLMWLERKSNTVILFRLQRNQCDAVHILAFLFKKSSWIWHNKILQSVRHGVQDNGYFYIICILFICE